MLPSPISIETSGRPGAVAEPDSTRSAADAGDCPAAGRRGLGQRAVMALIRGYQLAFSPAYAGSCRYIPSCSAYALEAVERFGAIRGSWLAVRRLARCHPFGGHGLDPVPAPKSKTVDL